MKLLIMILIGLGINFILLTPYILYICDEADKVRPGILSINYPTWLTLGFGFVSGFLGIILGEKYIK